MIVSHRMDETQTNECTCTVSGIPSSLFKPYPLEECRRMHSSRIFQTLLNWPGVLCMQKRHNSGNKWQQLLTKMGKAKAPFQSEHMLHWWVLTGRFHILSQGKPAATAIRSEFKIHVATCKSLLIICIQWNLRITDTIGISPFVHYSEVSLTQRFFHNCFI